MKKITTLLAAVAAVALGASALVVAGPVTFAPEQRIVGGAVDEMPDVGWTAALIDRGFYVCSGSLVAPRFVLTAAHCTRGTRASQWTVRLGSKNRARGGDVRRVRRILEFPGYRPALDYGDMALLRLRAPAAVKPVGLVQRGTHWTGEAAYVAGWGQTAPRIRKAPRLLHSGWIPIRAGSVCSRHYGWGFNRGVMVCAGVSSVSACMGDSGGPLARRIGGEWALLGVTSFGTRGCNRPGSYAWVGAKPLRRWLRVRLGR